MIDKLKIASQPSYLALLLFGSSATQQEITEALNKSHKSLKPYIEAKQV